MRTSSGSPPLHTLLSSFYPQTSPYFSTTIANVKNMMSSILVSKSKIWMHVYRTCPKNNGQNFNCRALWIHHNWYKPCVNEELSPRLHFIYPLSIRRPPPIPATTTRNVKYMFNITLALKSKFQNSRVLRKPPKKEWLKFRWLSTSKFITRA